jgi:hypothetical protein
VTPLAEYPEPVPLTLLAVNSNLRSVAVIDLAAGTVTTYPPDAHHLPMANPTDGAMITSRGDAVVWPGPGVYVLPGGDFSRPPIEITPSHLRCSPADALAELRVVPSPDGSRLWIVDPHSQDLIVDPDSPDTSTRIELVDIDTAEVLVEAEVELLLFPNAATDDSLILNSDESSDEGEAQRGVVVRDDGGVGESAIGRVIAVHDDIGVTLDPDNTTLRLVDLETEQTRTVDLPTPGSWNSVAGPSADGYWTPMPTVSAGGELLMSVVRDHDADGNPAVSTLYAISLADGTSRPLAEFDGRAPDATWSRDGNRVVLFPITRYDDHAVQEVAVLDPNATDAGPVVVATVPAEHLVVGAG